MNENLRELAIEGNPAAIFLIAIMFILGFIWIIMGSPMPVHEDTGRPVKSLNSNPGRNAARRRRYHERKHE